MAAKAIINSEEKAAASIIGGEAKQWRK